MSSQFTKPIYALLLSIGIILGFASDRASIYNEDICGLPNNAFGDQEVLVYKLYYNLSFIWIPAGEVTFRLSETDSTYEANIEGRSYGSYDNFFKVRDQFYSSIDKETMMPSKFVRKAEEGRHLRFDSLVFDYADSLIYSFNGLKRETAVWDTFDLQSCTQDLVSVMYNLRNIDLWKYHSGDNVGTQIFFDKEYHPLDIVYLKKQVKKVRGLGKMKTIKVRPKVIIGNIFDKDDEMSVWISDDQNKIPLLIQSPIRIGSVKAVLINYENLRAEHALGL